MTKRTSDPLIDALIAKLPETGEDWPVDRQVSWLHLMAIAFGAVYGGDAAAQVFSDGPKADPPKFQSPVTMPQPQNPAFMIDGEGYVRNRQGDRLMPGDVKGTLVDTRPEDAADLGSIIWADDSTGVAGAGELHIELAA